MGVPKMSQLRPGIGVNVVLKADQRSGRLTTGSVFEVLFVYFGALEDIQEHKTLELLQLPVALRLAACKNKLLTPAFVDTDSW